MAWPAPQQAMAASGLMSKGICRLSRWPRAMHAVCSCSASSTAASTATTSNRGGLASCLQDAGGASPCAHARYHHHRQLARSHRAYGQHAAHGGQAGRGLQPLRASEAEAAGTELGLGTLRRRVAAMQQRLQEALAVADVAGARARLASLEASAAEGAVWEDPQRAQQLMAQINSIRFEIDAVCGLQATLDDAAFALELLESTQDAAEQGECMGEATGALDRLEAGLTQWETRRLLSGQFDDRSARLVIQAGAGGVDAMDWAEMLERMYTRWAQSMGYSVRTIERTAGEEAGVKSVALEVDGGFAYGYLRSEKGTHRLVRSSPFNAKGLRQTSFAGVELMPILGDMQVELDIKDSDLQLSFQRSGGAGGQNVNKVETGVRITHVPTGLSVKCTQERSQQLNRAIAMDMLKAKLLVVLEEQQAEKVAQIRGDIVQASFGQQIRNYVLHPYKMVKDTRTGVETSDVQGVLDGALLPFQSAFLRLQGRKATQLELAEAEALS